MTHRPGELSFTGRSPARDFAEISDDKEVCSRLKEVYKTVDRVEFYPGLFAEPVRTNAALPLLAAELVAVDAFSQALTNPLLSDHLFNEQTFTKVGMEVIKFDDLPERHPEPEPSGR